MATLYAVFVCARLIHPDPATGSTAPSCAVADLRARFQTIEGCNAYRGTLDRPDARPASWYECRLTDQPPPGPEEVHADRATMISTWAAQITSQIRRNWIMPAPMHPAIVCVLNVTQAPGGNVTNVTIGECNADQPTRESIKAAVYRSSPLPPPPDPSLFDPELVITFKPN